MSCRARCASRAALLCVALAAPLEAAPWKSIGPEGGVVFALAVEPGSASDASVRAHVYAATANGVYRSVDSGATWARASRGLTHVVGSLAVDPKAPGTVYAAETQETLLPQPHIFVSQDAGEHWSERTLPAAAIGVVVDGDGFVYTRAAYGELLWRSRDHGRHWRSLRAPASFLHLAADPVRHLLFGWSVGGFYRSADGGKSWVDLSAQAPPGIGWCSQIGGEARPPGRLYLAIASDFDAGECHSPRGTTYASDDGGEHWARTGPGGFPLAVGPHREVYSGQFRSFDRGLTWHGFSVPRDDFGGLALDSSGTVLLIASRTRGVLRSHDGGASWDRASGVRASPVQTLAVDPTAPQHLVAYDWARGLVSTHDGGATWSGARCLTPGGCAVQGYLPFFLGVAVDPFDSQFVYVASADGFRRSPDGGHSLAHIQPPGVGCLQFQSFAPDPWTPGTLYASGFLGDSCDPGADFCSAFVSRDRGDSWECMPLAYAQRIVVAPSRTGTLYATAEGLPQEGTTVRVSHDGGDSWSFLANVPEFTTLVVDPADEQLLLAAANEGFWRSRDGGTTWTEVLEDSLTGEGLVALDGHDPNLLVVADPDHGVRWSRDDGATWRTLPPTDVLGTLGHSYPALLVDPARAGRIYVAGGSGVVRTTLPPR